MIASEATDDKMEKNVHIILKFVANAQAAGSKVQQRHMHLLCLFELLKHGPTLVSFCLFMFFSQFNDK